VVSVLGYGLMLKTSSFNGKSKSRAQTSDIQSAPGQQGNNRELSIIPAAPLFPNETALSASRSGKAHAIETLHGMALRYPALPTSVPLRSIRRGNHSDCTPLPHNLLQQNPVLLI